MRVYIILDSFFARESAFLLISIQQCPKIHRRATVSLLSFRCKYNVRLLIISIEVSIFGRLQCAIATWVTGAETDHVKDEQTSSSSTQQSTGPASPAIGISGGTQGNSLKTKRAINCFKVIVLNHITKLSFTWSCSPCEFTIENLPLKRRPTPRTVHKGFIYLFVLIFWLTIAMVVILESMKRIAL